ncbi:hypothetical protein PIB30_013311 [Stylosanthes scabra]|uniref:Transmembrane protein n=1 Tax=Stylosanthes scabra TaxID=79078 RepID=A0ABU6T637_9FABA|nr:hypothetical protein [Stylosanthes scabra]
MDRLREQDLWRRFLGRYREVVIPLPKSFGIATDFSDRFFRLLSAEEFQVCFFRRRLSSVVHLSFFAPFSSAPPVPVRRCSPLLSTKPRVSITRLFSSSGFLGLENSFVLFFISKILETAFKKETVGLVTGEQYVEKRVNIHSKIEEEEKEKLQKQQQE